MAERRSCDVCSREYVAQRRSSRFCSDTCRKRNLRRPGVDEVADVVEIPAAPAPEPARPPRLALTATTAAELEAAGRLETVLGQQAMVLARRIDGAAALETGSAVASLSREFRAVMAEALAGVRAAADPVDELRARRDSKRSAS